MNPSSMSPEREPLWLAMRHAYDQSSVPDELLESADAYDCLTDRYGYAAEIRALRDWLVPKEYLPDPPDEDSAIDRRVWDWVSQRQSLRALLTAEADRAESPQSQPPALH